MSSTRRKETIRERIDKYATTALLEKTLYYSMLYNSHMMLFVRYSASNEVFLQSLFEDILSHMFLYSDNENPTWRTLSEGYTLEVEDRTYGKSSSRELYVTIEYKKNLSVEEIDTLDIIMACISHFLFEINIIKEADFILVLPGVDGPDRHKPNMWITTETNRGITYSSTYSKKDVPNPAAYSLNEDYVRDIDTEVSEAAAMLLIPSIDHVINEHYGSKDWSLDFTDKGDVAIFSKYIQKTIEDWVGFTFRAVYSEAIMVQATYSYKEDKISVSVYQEDKQGLYRINTLVERLKKSLTFLDLTIKVGNHVRQSV